MKFGIEHRSCNDAQGESATGNEKDKKTAADKSAKGPAHDGLPLLFEGLSDHEEEEEEKDGSAMGNGETTGGAEVVTGSKSGQSAAMPPLFEGISDHEEPDDERVESATGTTPQSGTGRDRNDTQRAGVNDSALPRALADATRYRARFEGVCQEVFSRFQHHWHSKDAEGRRVPQSYCREKGRRTGKKGAKTKSGHVEICKQDFPRKLNVKTPVVLCQGLAQKFGLKVKEIGRAHV